MNVVLLSTSKDRIDAVRAASRRKGFACTVASDIDHACRSIGEADSGILVVDHPFAGHWGEILKSRSPQWPILVLAARFDSRAWVELFKAGASEIIGDPLSPQKLDAALDGFLNPPAPVRSEDNSLWRMLARHLGLRAGPPVR